MKRRIPWLALGASVFAAGAWAACAAWEASKPPARIVATPASAEFERRRADDPERQRLVIRLHNAGGRAARIEKVASTCGCAAPGAFQPVRLAPGQQVEVPIELTIAPFQSTTALISIQTNAALTPLLEIPVELRGRLFEPPELSVAPECLSFLGESPGQTVEREFILQTLERRDETAWIVDRQQPHPRLSIECELQPDERGDDNLLVQRLYRCRARAELPADVAGRVVLPVRLATTGNSHKMRAFWVDISIDPAVRAVPGELFFALSAGQALPVERCVELKAARAPKATFRLAADQPQVDWIEARVLDHQPGAGARLQVRIVKRPPSDDPAVRLLKSVVTVVANDSDPRPIAIPVSVWLQ